MKCENCGKETVYVDYPIKAIRDDFDRYHIEDTEWGIWPDEEVGDPGWVVAKSGTIPIGQDCEKVKSMGQHLRDTLKRIEKESKNGI